MLLTPGRRAKRIAVYASRQCVLRRASIHLLALIYVHWRAMGLKSTASRLTVGLGQGV
ncbi:hypothetical protein BDZ85DRAFT_261235 [Elsinoe ampelina]|uniref:Uncharacterized protein n=1 Tax=Elsinoe ampelina TaxID=302913 RepID=A0A6A6GFU1_9PEZI|nr:hypothetical protein BDZ85DRAFT_261235 [Elsinoe ampelina]